MQNIQIKLDVYEILVTAGNGTKSEQQSLSHAWMHTRRGYTGYGIA